ncbi:ExbD/TolR family protein [Aquimonas voraii]|uniref:Biopolymer transport protein ExbD n=1 Tax=Aquimonas voraii TaxID=265719 RepID=A0A1G6WJL2_9GAMM|nr:biopolymer transporter ExbD [Aquimonas voraii]SDD65988.1 biopolymer transport protein ExbD [Aquimonas voraii]
MAFTTGGGGGAMADINVTPLVDVMLVLLIIFLVTAPMLTREIEIDLPQQSNKQPEEVVDPPQPIRLRIDADGSLFWDNSPMPKAALLPSLRVEASRDPQPLLEIEANQEVQYHVLTEVLSEAKNADMKKIGFVETL